MTVTVAAQPAFQRPILERLPGRLPTTPIPDDISDLESIAERIVSKFPSLDDSQFTDDTIWRDSYALTGTFRTFYFQHTVAKQWALLSQRRGVSSAHLVKGSSKISRAGADSAWLECKFVFSTTSPATECSGFLSLVPDQGKGGNGWKIWVFRTVLEQIPGVGDVDRYDVPGQAKNGVKDGLVNGNTVVNGHTDTSLTNGYTNGHHNEHVKESGDVEHFHAVIVGGGQAGLSTGGRLQALGVSYVILEKNDQVGDAWKSRYRSAKLHTIREYAHLPFDRTFDDSFPEYLGKEELAVGHRRWAAKYGINIWLSTTLVSGLWDEAQKLYTLTVRKNGEVSQITAKHVVLATGAGSQTPIMPAISDREQFKGIVIHSAEYDSADAWKGMSGIVIGTANTGHDVADDMCEAGMDVTMVQRSRTFVLPLEYIEDRYKTLYNSALPTETSDRIMFTNPVAIARLTSARAFHPMARAQPERWAALEKAGFKVEPYGDIQDAINIRLGGHYIDVGTSAKISKGLIKVKSDSLATSYTATGLAFADGTTINADVIVFATGFLGNLQQHVQALFGEEVATRAGPCFGLSEEGEILGAFKPLSQPGMWYIGGALGHARWYSRFLALSIKADEMGSPLPVYTGSQHRLDEEEM